MTKVQRTLRLQRPLDEPLMEKLAEANSIYGIDSIRLSPNGEEIVVEHDATRLRAADVVSTFERFGIPVA